MKNAVQAIENTKMELYKRFQMMDLGGESYLGTQSAEDWRTDFDRPETLCWEYSEEI